ncbi:hypothetical protein [Aggregatibacter aphrophilus]|nr:hypothetical protein DPV90_00035 [Aggregatibacter aphrophilus]
MENFSWVSSVIIPAFISLFSSSIMYIVGGRKEKNSYYNSSIDKIEQMLDATYNAAKDIFSKDYADEDYHFMVYQNDNLHTELSRLDKEIGVFELSTLKRILTDNIFHKKENATMESLSKQIHVIKKNLCKRCW